MKKFLILLATLFCGAVFADTINLHWKNYDGSTYEDSTCVIDSDLILPATTPTRYGYTFTGWKIANYQPIEYLESTGTQWIDTGVIADYGCIIETRITPINRWFFVGSVCTEQENIPDATRNVVFNRGRTNLYTQKGPLSNYDYNMTGYSYPMDIYLNTIGSSFIAKINGQTLINRNDTYNLPKQTQSIKLGYDNWDGTVFRQINFYIKIWDSNNVLVRDMIPVLDANNIPCMFDRVEGKFYYNQGTDQFIAGPAL